MYSKLKEGEMENYKVNKVARITAAIVAFVVTIWTVLLMVYSTLEMVFIFMFCAAIFMTFSPPLFAFVGRKIRGIETVLVSGKPGEGY